MYSAGGNSGSLITELQHFFKTIEQTKKSNNNPLSLIGIVVDIAYRNPKTYPLCAAILSTLVKSLTTQKPECVVSKIQKKFERIPNTGYMEIWLQRAIMPSKVTTGYNEKICHLVDQKPGIRSLWNVDWISCPILEKAICTPIIVPNKLNDCREKAISSKEIELFVDKNIVES